MFLYKSYYRPLGGDIEDITWPRGDTKSLFKCWKIFHEWAQQTSEIFFQHEKRNLVSPSAHVMFYLLYKHQWNTKPFHVNSFWFFINCSLSNGDIFASEDNMLFSHVKISCFCAKTHLVFHQCLCNKSDLFTKGTVWDGWIKIFSPFSEGKVDMVIHDW